ncbi:alkaline phosphatase [Endozoicomonas sp. G2_1]|uniref:alkaline phosphatase n=1 Tax=Endozoicomonas sp. G2_1 TaxID=2821091 RepID=UPI001ADC9706|nr:alkaline phosphatase [Endozoicomonas sp. G2_1]MBO9492269.1 alkaline phosphatase [Endozoicomonas sp. G2_1]
MKKIISGIALAISPLIAFGHGSAAHSVTPKNVIMVVADGMGPVYPTAYRLFKDDPKTPVIEETVFDRHLVGTATTYPAPVSGYVTDSAAAATALSSGIKTYNGAIGLDADKKLVKTVLEYANEQNKKTGMVVTSQINHATPASYIAHNEYRRNYNAIADTYLDDSGQLKADIVLGGGWQYFIRDDRNIVAEHQKAGGFYLDNTDQLTQLPKGKKVLGLFADVGLPWALDDKNPHRLVDMTKAAIKHLENPNGYFMLVEASQVDWAGHSNDVASAMAEMDDLAQTMKYLEQYVQAHPDTLVVLTADHNTGGFSIGANGEYAWRPAILKTMTQSAHTIAEKLAAETITAKKVSELLNVNVTKDETAKLVAAKISGQEAVAAYKQLTPEQQKKQRAPSVQASLYKAVKKLIDVRTNTGWTTGGHTGVDVNVYAFGHSKDKFAGNIDNTDIAKKIFKLLK